MFFNNIETWSKSKLRVFKYILLACQLIFSMIIPMLIVGNKYGLFKKVSGWKLTASGLIVVLIVGFHIVKYVIGTAKKLPENTYNQRKIKYSMALVGHMFIPLLMIFIGYQIKKNAIVGYNTLKWCMLSMCVSTFIEWMFTAYVEHELSIFDDAEHQMEVNNKIRLMNK